MCGFLLYIIFPCFNVFLLLQALLKFILKLIKSELLAMACKYLRESNVKIGEISDMLHFNNVYTFSRFIKNNTGLSHNSYRKKYSQLV